MSKVKKISINAFEKVVKEKFENSVTAEWNGLTITITKTISLQDMMSLVSEVSENCFLENGSYLPEVMQVLLYCGVVERYTNINLPSKLEARYDLVSKSGIMDFILSHINTSQYNDIVVAVRDKVDYLCDSRSEELDRAMDKMIESINELQKTTTNLFGNVSQDVVNRIAETVCDDRKIEEKVVAEYISKKNEPLRIVGEGNGS